MVLISEKSFPHAKIDSVPCKWHQDYRDAHRAEFDVRLAAWHEQAARHQAQTKEVPWFEETVFVEVVSPKGSCAWKPGKIIEFTPLEFKTKGLTPEPGAAYEDCWIEGKILEIKEIERGTRTIYPNWQLEAEPKYKPFRFSHHDAVSEMKQLIRVVCPNAHWEGFWDEYPTCLGYEDTVRTETEKEYQGRPVVVETGTGYLVKVEGDRLNLYKFQIEREYYVSGSFSVSDSECGIGSWSDKGYW